MKHNRATVPRMRIAADIRLEPLSSADFSCIRPWIDPAVFRIFHAPVDDEQLAMLLTTDEKDGRKSLGYRIVSGTKGEIIGLIHATIDMKNNLAHIGQIVVDPSQRRKGYASAGLMQFLDICFNDLGQHRVQLFVDDDNAGAIACYRKAGFQIEGLMRDATKVGKGYISWYSMSILAEEWLGGR